MVEDAAHAPRSTTGGADEDDLLDPLREIVANSRTPLLRVAFDDDAVWERVAAALTGRSAVGGWASRQESLVDDVADRRYEGVEVDRLAKAWPADLLAYAIVADERTMSEGDATGSIAAVSVLYVDLSNERGRTFRTAVDQVAGVSMNLSIANVDFEEYANAAGPDGVFRGF